MIATATETIRPEIAYISAGMWAYSHLGGTMPKVGDSVKVRVYADIARITLVGRVVSVYDKIWTGNPGIKVEFYNSTEEQYVIATIDVESLEKTEDGWKSK
jgi:hypothetical protein